MPSRRPNNKRDVSNRIFFRNEQGQKNVKNHRNRDLVSQMTITQVIRDESSISIRNSKRVNCPNFTIDRRIWVLLHIYKNNKGLPNTIPPETIISWTKIQVSEELQPKFRSNDE